MLAGISVAYRASLWHIVDAVSSPYPQSDKALAILQGLDSADAKFDLAYALYRDNQMAAALELLDQVPADHPGVAWLRGQAHYNAGHYAEAAAAYDTIREAQASTAHGVDAELWANLAAAQACTGKALDDSAAPAAADVLFNQCIAHVHAGEYAEAVALAGQVSRHAEAEATLHGAALLALACVTAALGFATDAGRLIHEAQTVGLSRLNAGLAGVNASLLKHGQAELAESLRKLTNCLSTHGSKLAPSQVCQVHDAMARVALALRKKKALAQVSVSKLSPLTLAVASQLGQVDVDSLERSEEVRAAAAALSAPASELAALDSSSFAGTAYLAQAAVAAAGRESVPARPLAADDSAVCSAVSATTTSRAPAAKAQAIAVAADTATGAAPHGPSAALQARRLRARAVRRERHVKALKERFGSSHLPALDPERWVPKSQRSNARRRRKYKSAPSQGAAAAVGSHVDQLDAKAHADSGAGAAQDSASKRLSARERAALSATRKNRR